MSRALAISSVFVLAACASPDLGARGVGAQPLSGSDEAGLWMAMGRAEEDLLRSPALNQEEALNAYVHDVVCRVAAEYCAELRVYVVNRPYFNATMAPNGMMEVWSGLLLRAQNEAQLAFVVGHEATHYVENHSLESWRTAKRTSGAAVVFSLGMAAAGAGAVGDLGSLIAIGAMFGYSRENERQADEIGLERAIAAGYDPTQAAEIWKLLAEENANSDDEESRRREARGGVFNTHPLTAERIASLEAQAEGRGTGMQNADRHAEMIAPHLPAWLDAELRRRDFGESLFLIGRLEARDRDLGVLKYFEAEAYRQRAEEGDAALARAAYLEAAGHADAPAAAWRQIGEIMRAEGNAPQAIAAFETYLARAPEAADRLIIESYLSSLRGQT